MVPRNGQGPRYAGAMALPRKFLNDDEELLAEMHPHWIFLFGPLFSSIGVWAAIIVLLILWRNPPGWTNYPIIIIALIPALWLLGRFVRWKSYDVALTSTRILVRQGIIGRDTVQLRLQRITEVNLRQTLIERALGTGSLVIDVQGEDDSLTLEYMRQPAVVQRVINSQINEIVGGGQREMVPEDMLPPTSPHPAHPDRDDIRATTDTTSRHGHPALRGRPVRLGRAGTAARTGAPRPGHRALRNTRPAHSARRPPQARHHLRGGVRRQEERAPQPHLKAAGQHLCNGGAPGARLSAVSPGTINTTPIAHGKRNDDTAQWTRGDAACTQP